MHQGPVRDHMRKTQPTYVVFYRMAPLSSTAARGNNANRGHTTIPKSNRNRAALSTRNPNNEQSTPVTDSTFVQPSPADRKSVTLPVQLAVDHDGHLDPTSSEGVQDRVDQDALPSVSSGHHSVIRRDAPTDGGRNKQTTPEMCDYSSACMQRSIHQQSVPGREEGGVLSTNNQLETSKQIHPQKTLQDGRCEHDQGSSSAQGLDVCYGSQGRLSLSIRSPGRSQVPSFYLEWQNLRVYMPSFGLCSAP